MILTTSSKGCGTLVNLYLKLADFFFLTLGGNSAVSNNNSGNPEYPISDSDSCDPEMETAQTQTRRQGAHAHAHARGVEKKKPAH